MLQRQRQQPVRQAKMWGEPVKPVRLLLTATLLGFGFALGGLLFRVVSDGVSNQAGKRG
jgi:hypothetical protein